MVTYLLGAGASANALPLVGDDFKYRFGLFVDDIKRVRPAEQSRLKHYNLLLDDVLKHIKNHASPDTYAKKRFLLGEQHATIYDQFKRILSCYIIWEQIDKPNTELQLKSAEVQTLPNLTEHKKYLEKAIKVNDDRYDVLCAALQNSPAKLPDGFSLITWNYDWQFEKILNQYDFRNWPLHQTKDGLIDSKKLFKLNGSAWLNKKTELYKVFDKDEISEIEYLKAFYEIILDDKNEFVNELKFAWEEFGKNDFNPRKEANSILKKTTSLVVIGYSFPYYNRKVDADFLHNFYPLQENKRKIYLQYPSEDLCKKMENKIRLIIKHKTTEHESNIDRRIEYIHISDVDQFYIPDELL